jgi:hypothetical protein
MSSIKYGTAGLKLLKLFPFPPLTQTRCLTVSTFRSVQNQCQQKVFFGIHFYSPGREGPAAGIAKADEFQLILRRDNGDDLIFVSHQYHERREHIGGRVWAGRLIR